MIPQSHRKTFYQAVAFALALVLLVSGCQPAAMSSVPLPAPLSAQTEAFPTAVPAEAAQTPVPATPFPARPRYAPGELVDYTAQAGDTLPVLAIRFNTTVGEILQANPFIPVSATTMPPGMPMKMPVYYLPLWGSAYQILPDSLFVNGPAQVDFDTQAFVAGQPGWLKKYRGFAAGVNRNGAQIVDYIARQFSVSPRLLLALLEYQAGALTEAELDPARVDYPLGYPSWEYKGLHMQLVWLANRLNNGYYAYRKGDLTSLERRDARVERFDPWQNAATVSLMSYFNTLFDVDRYTKAIAHDGFAQTYRDLFGDPWQAEHAHIPGSLVQPMFTLPFEPGFTWAYTGGPHTGWGSGEPLAALDFAPPSVAEGCLETGEWATAIADGVVVRSETGEVMLDLDGDGDERTGWNIFYLHIATQDRVALGTVLKQGDPLGHPSCEGGTSTGTHVHIARKYNGEWLPAEGFGGVLAFDLDGWLASDGVVPYKGTLRRGSQVVTACVCSNQTSFIAANPR
jgi:murein DD-endopeptidase MepM/ murein hydrolase activator NlpD